MRNASREPHHIECGELSKIRGAIERHSVADRLALDDICCRWLYRKRECRRRANGERVCSNGGQVAFLIIYRCGWALPGSYIIKQAT